MKSNKRIAFLLLLLPILALIIVLILDIVPAKEKSTIQSIRIGLTSNNSLYNYQSEGNMPVGYNIDIINAVALEMGFDVSFTEIDPMETHISLVQNKVDCVVGVDYAHIPVEYIAKTAPFLNNKIFAFSLKSSHSTGLDHALTVCVNIEDSQAEYILNHLPKGTKALLADNLDIALELLTNSLADFYVGDQYVTLRHIEGTKYEDILSGHNRGENDAVTTLVVLTENKHIVDTFTIGMRKIKSKGTFATITQKWFGDSVPNWQRLSNILLVVLLSASFVLVIVLVFARMNLMLKRQVEERTMMIKEEKLLNESIISSLFEGLIFTDKNFVIRSANPAAYKILNQEGSLEGKNLYTTERCRIFKEDDLKYVFENKEKIISHEAEFNMNGIERTVEYVVNPVLNEQQDIIGINLIFRDITEEKSIKQKNIAKDKLETVGRLTAGIAHEIRNPLTAIGMYMKLLPGKIDNESFRSQLLEDIPKEISRLDDIISSLLDYAKPSPPQKESFHLQSELDYIMRFLDNQLEHHHIRCEIHTQPQIYILFDLNQFKQIIFNIVINSIDALKVLPDELERRIGIAAWIKDEKCHIELTDNGGGISRELMGKLFEPFSSTKEQGYGLGLSIVHHLIGENSSEIYYDTAYIGGAKFVIEIPLSEKHTERLLQ